MPGGPGAGFGRRRVLAGMVLAPAALSACSTGSGGRPDEPDPLIELASAARSDAAVAAAAITTDAALAARVQPLVDARTQHATALDAEIRRVSRNTPAPTTSSGVPAAASGSVTLVDVRDAARASAAAAAALVLTLPLDRVGLVASVAACCDAHAAALT